MITPQTMVKLAQIENEKRAAARDFLLRKAAYYRKLADLCFEKSAALEKQSDWKSMLTHPGTIGAGIGALGGAGLGALAAGPDKRMRGALLGGLGGAGLGYGVGSGLNALSESGKEKPSTLETAGSTAGTVARAVIPRVKQEVARKAMQGAQMASRGIGAVQTAAGNAADYVSNLASDYANSEVGQDIANNLEALKTMGVDMPRDFLARSSVAPYLGAATSSVMGDNPSPDYSVTPIGPGVRDSVDGTVGVPVMRGREGDGTFFDTSGMDNWPQVDGVPTHPSKIGEIYAARRRAQQNAQQQMALASLLGR